MAAGPESVHKVEVSQACFPPAGVEPISHLPAPSVSRLPPQ